MHHGTSHFLGRVLLRASYVALLLGPVVMWAGVGSGSVANTATAYCRGVPHTVYVCVYADTSGYAYVHWQDQTTPAAGDVCKKSALDGATGSSGTYASGGAMGSATVSGISTGDHTYSAGWAYQGSTGGSNTDVTVAFHYDAPTNAVTSVIPPLTNSYSFHLKNNTDAARSISLKTGVTTVATLALGALETKTFSGTVTGVVGTTVSLDPTPVWDQTYDPQMTMTSGGSITRSGHYGGPAVLRHVFLTVVSWCLASPVIDMKLDGTSLGHVMPTAQTDSVLGMVTKFHWDLELSPDSVITFTTDSPHVLNAPVNDFHGDANWIYVRELDRGLIGGVTYSNASYSVNQGTGDVSVVQTAPSGTTYTTTGGGNMPPANTDTTPVSVDVTGTGQTQPGQLAGWTDTGSTTQATGLDKGTYEAGVNQLLGGIGVANGHLAAIEKNTGDTAANTAAIASNTGRAADRLDANKVADDAAHTTLTNQTADVGSLVSNSISTAAGWASSAVSQASAGRGTMTAPAVPSGAEMSLSVDFGPVGNEHPVLDLNPFNAAPSWVLTVIAWVKALIGWATVTALCRYCYREIRRSILGVLSTQKQLAFSFEGALDSNPITAAGSVLGRAVAIAVLATAVVVMPTALIQVFGTQWEVLLTSFVSTVSAAGGGSEWGTIWSWIQRVIPVPTMMSAAATYPLFELALMWPQITWQFILRFMPV